MTCSMRQKIVTKYQIARTLARPAAKFTFQYRNFIKCESNFPTFNSRKSQKKIKNKGNETSFIYWEIL